MRYPQRTPKYGHVIFGTPDAANQLSLNFWLASLQVLTSIFLSFLSVFLSFPDAECFGANDCMQRKDNR